MNREALRALLVDVSAGRLEIPEALRRLQRLPFEDLGFARVDHHRALRAGGPEAIFCPGKSPGQVVAIAHVTDQDELLLVTEQGQIIRMMAGDLRPIGRDTQGVKLMDLAEGDRIVSIAALSEI